MLCNARWLALRGLANEGITLGARKRRGFGRIAVKNWRVKQYDLTRPDQLIDWLKNGSEPLAKQNITARLELTEHHLFTQFQSETLIDNRHQFRMEATFALDGSLLIRANGQPHSNSPDMVHLSDQADRPLLPGTSIAGALRNRALRILNLLHANTAEQWIDDLFGADLPEGKQKRRQQDPNIKSSRLIVEETAIENAQFDLVQNRVAIDRFTGGAKDSALFNEQPVFGKNKGKDKTHVHINLTVRNPKKRDIGLLLLILKDLWTGDLPLGGEVSVGRGRLAGNKANIFYRYPKTDAEGKFVHDEKGNTVLFQMNGRCHRRIMG